MRPMVSGERSGTGHVDRKHCLRFAFSLCLSRRKEILRAGKPRRAADRTGDEVLTLKFDAALAKCMSLAKLKTTS